MKTLFLLRHAKSDWADPGRSDFDRALNARGRNAALAMGRELRRLGLAADHILASPAARAVETLTLLSEGYGGPMPPAYDERLYLASAEVLLTVARSVDDRDGSLLLVGHNPGLQQLALLLAAESPLRAQIAAANPTGAFAQLAFECDHWRALDPGAATLVRFLRPRDLASGGS